MNIEHVNGDVLVPLFWSAIWVPIDGAAEFGAQQQRGNLIAEAIPFHRYLAFPFPPEMAVYHVPTFHRPLFGLFKFLMTRPRWGQRFARTFQQSAEGDPGTETSEFQPEYTSYRHRPEPGTHHEWLFWPASRQTK